MQELLDLLVARRQDILNDWHEEGRLSLVIALRCSTYVALTVQSADDDATHGLQLDLIRALLEGIAEVLR